MSTAGAASLAASVGFRPASGHIGAEITGVDLRSPLDKSTLDAIREIEPGLYLGKVYWDKKRLIDFALKF